MIIRSSINPNKLIVIKEIPTKNDLTIYHDFDKDGISETVHIYNSVSGNSHTIHILDQANNFIDQLNYFEPINIMYNKVDILFADYNSDGLDDVFTFTHSGDSLFLYIHDLHLKRVILSRHFLLKSQSPYSKAQNQYSIKGIKLIEINGEEKKALLFSSCSGRSIRPRGVYLFDIEKLKIIKRFESDAFINNVLMYDLTGDGKDEIILTSDAVGNVHYHSQYTDQKCWLFVLDQNLKNIFEPLSFGEYTSGLTCYPVVIGSERFLLLAHRFSGGKNISETMSFINSKGKILPERKFNFSKRTAFPNLLVVDEDGNDIKIYTFQGEKNIVMLDKNFNITNSITTEFDGIAPVAIKDLNNDGEQELICLANDNIVVLSNNLELLVSIHEPVDHLTTISFRENGKNKPTEIGINSLESHLLISMEKNDFYGLLPIVAVAFSLLLFAMFLVMFLTFSRLFIFFKYHRFSLASSNEGAIMLDYFGVIKDCNEKAKNIFNLNQNSIRNNYFDIKLLEFPRLVELIKESMGSNRVVSEWLSIPNGNSVLEGEVCITPIFSRFKILQSYLVEFQDNNDSIVSNKLVIWSKAAQRMVHDIKYPLSVAAVKLDTLKTRIKALPIGDNDNINDDFEVIKSEIKRVNSIAKSFLKFSELEKPNFQAASVKDIIMNCLKRYEGFINEKLQIQIAIDEDVESIWADEQQIELALHTLVENSIDAVNGNGFVKISASLAQYLDDSLTERVEIEVADTGPGIDEKIRENIFQPHTTTKADGTGIGLAIAKKIIEDHGSKIDFYSKPGFGTVVRFDVKVPQKLDN